MRILIGLVSAAAGVGLLTQPAPSLAFGAMLLAVALGLLLAPVLKL